MQTRCEFCRIGPETKTLDEFMNELKHCNNCRVDMAAKGEWNGVAWLTFKRILESEDTWSKTDGVEYEETLTLIEKE